MSYLDWKVGDRVVCIRDNWIIDGGNERRPVRGSVYTIREIDASDKGVFIKLSEIVNPVLRYRNGYREADFHAVAFRKVQPRKTSIAIFTAMLNGAKERERA